MPKNIMTIPATKDRYTAESIENPGRKKVAAYARVSTDREEQLSSYEAQMDYYTNYIKSREDWEFAGLYSDQGISATSTKHRFGFKEMIDDAMAGKINLIITKSVSRFARNTVDSLTTIRMLKDAGIAVIFEKENINTLENGEFLLTLMSSLAQEESRSISQNVTWGQRKRFADGKVSVAYSTFLGYDKGPDGSLVINEEQAKIVRLIFKLFLEGMTPHSIGKELERRGIKTVTGKDKWSPGAIRRMLSQEKYKGDALLQKEFTVDFLSKKMKKNEGEVPQYYITGDHPYIIEPAVFDLVQAELEKRGRSSSYKYSGVSIFSGKVKCGECGGWYGARTWHSTDKYRRIVYQCNHKYGRNGQKGRMCSTPHLKEEEIKGAFVRGVNKLISEKDEVMKNMDTVIKQLCDVRDLEAEKEGLSSEMEILVDMANGIVAENTRKAQNQEEYNRRYNDVMGRYETAKNRFREIEAEIESRNNKAQVIREVKRGLGKCEGTVVEFDETMWGTMLDCMIVEDKGSISVRFWDGSEVRV